MAGGLKHELWKSLSQHMAKTGSEGKKEMRRSTMLITCFVQKKPLLPLCFRQQPGAPQLCLSRRTPFSSVLAFPPPLLMTIVNLCVQLQGKNTRPKSSSSNFSGIRHKNSSFHL